MKINKKEKYGTRDSKIEQKKFLTVLYAAKKCVKHLKELDDTYQKTKDTIETEICWMEKENS